MKQGEIGPLIEMANGFHIIRLAERHYAGKVPLRRQDARNHPPQAAKRRGRARNAAGHQRDERKATIQLLDTDG